jgi:hypothetical protein
VASQVVLGYGGFGLVLFCRGCKMRLALLEGKEACCCLCSWKRTPKEPARLERTVLEHLRLFHGRIMVERVERKKGKCKDFKDEDTGKAIEWHGPVWKNDLGM